MNHAAKPSEGLSPTRSPEASAWLDGQRLERAFDAADMGFWEWDVTNGTSFMSAGWYRLVAQDPLAFPPAIDTWERLMHPDDRARVAVALRAHVKGESAQYETEHRLRHADGRWIWVLVRGRVVRRDARGRALHMTGTVTDVTALKETTAALHREAAFGRDVFEASPDCAKLLDLQGRVERFNANGLRLMELESDAPLVGREWASLWPEASVEGVRQAVREALADRVGRVEGFCPTARGTPKWWDVCVSPIRDETGAVTRLLAVSRDVTAAKAATERLKESEQRYRALFEHVPVGIYRTSPRGRLLAANPALVEMLGFPDLASVQARSTGSLYVDSTARARWREMLERDNVVSGHEVEIRRWDGTTIWVRHSARVTRGPDGAVLHYEGAVEDVTERRRAEEALRESEGRFQQLAEQTAEMFWLLELGPRLEDSRMIYVNSAYERITGLRRDEVYASRTFGLERILREDVERVLDAARAVAAGESRIVEYALDTAGGRLTVRTRMYPIHDAEGKVFRIGGFTEDVTPQRLLEEQVRQSARMDAVGQLAGGVAHDFNNLLMVIGASTQFAIEDVQQDSSVFGDLLEIERATARAMALTRQLLAFSRKQILRPEVLDLNRVIEELQPMLARLIGEDITVEVHLSPGLSAIRADPGQIEQVLVNLVVNARDAMPGGGHLVIETSEALVSHSPPMCSDASPASRYVRITVTDTGAGMDAQVQERIFEPFFTTKAPDKGTGLGLATAHGIVRQSGGCITVTSAPGAGTTFCIDLPALDGSAAGAREDGRVADREARALHDGTGKTVLLVEDEAGVRRLVQRILEGAGYTVLDARHGGDALAVASHFEGHIDLVLSDVVMPEMSGREFVDRFGSISPRTRVVFMSGYTDDEILRRGIETAGTALLEKPFGGAELLDAVRAVLRQA